VTSLRPGFQTARGTVDRLFSVLPLLVSAVTPFRYQVLAAPTPALGASSWLAIGFSAFLPLSYWPGCFSCVGSIPTSWYVWPGTVSINARLFESSDGSPIYSSRGHHPFLPRLRAVLLVLKTEGLANDTRGLYDLRDVQVKKVGSYWLKITGVSSMQAAGVPEEMRSGAGRWRLLAQRPGSMALYYVQTTLKQKLAVSNFGTRWIFDDNIEFS
jgi:hypothetical protein